MWNTLERQSLTSKSLDNKNETFFPISLFYNKIDQDLILANNKK